MASSWEYPSVIVRHSEAMSLSEQISNQPISEPRRSRFDRMEPISRDINGIYGNLVPPPQPQIMPEHQQFIFNLPPPVSGMYEGPPPLFPSAAVSASPNWPPPTSFAPSNVMPVVPPHILESTTQSTSEPYYDIPHITEVKEELFPPNKAALFQLHLENRKDTGFIGLEYVLEIQHNCVKRMPPIYSCLLCDKKTKLVETNISSFDQIKSHLRSVPHKLRYIETYFPTIKKFKIDKIRKGTDDYRNALSATSNKIEAYFGRMTVKIVVGSKLFKRRHNEIKKMIMDSTHFRENEEALDVILGEEYLDAKINRYEDAFAEYEKDLQKKNQDEKKEKRERMFKISGSRSPVEDTAINRASSRKSPSLRRSLSPEKRNNSLTSSAMAIGRGFKRDEPDRHSLEKRSRRSTSVEKWSRRSKSIEKRSRRSVSSEKRGQSRRSIERRDRRSVSTERRGRYSVERIYRSRSRERRYSGYESPNRLLSKEFEKEIERYLDKEKRLMEVLEEERQGYLNLPHTHKDYDTEWEKFYIDIQTKKNVENPDTLNVEWAEHWKNYFSKCFDAEIRQRKNILMHNCRISNLDLEDYYEQKARSLEEEVEKKKIGVENLEDNSKKIRLAALIDQTSFSRINTREVETSKEIRAEGEVKDTSVIATLRLLTALEGALDELGPGVLRLLAKANSIEVNEGHGFSSKLVDDQKAFNLLWEAKEKLSYKVSNNVLSGNQASASLACVNKITVLLKSSKCKIPIEDNCKVAHGGQTSTESSIKAAIAKTVVEQFIAQGKSITESQLAGIVEYEYQRVKSSLPSASSSLTLPPTKSSEDHEVIELDCDDEPNPIPESEEDMERLTCQQLADIFKKFQELNKAQRCLIMDYMKKIEKTNPARLTEMKRIIHSKN